MLYGCRSLTWGGAPPGTVPRVRSGYRRAPGETDARNFILAAVRQTHSPRRARDCACSRPGMSTHVDNLNLRHSHRKALHPSLGVFLRWREEATDDR